MKLKAKLLILVLVVSILHVLAFGYILFSTNALEANYLEVIIGGVLVTGIGIGLTFMISQSHKKALKEIEQRIILLASDEEVELPEVSIHNKELTEINEGIIQAHEKHSKMFNFIIKLTEQMNYQTEILDETVKNLTEGSNNITVAMQEISGGADEQAQSAATLTETMQQFSNTIMSVTLNGENIKNESTEMLNITNESRNLMDQSINKMTIIDKTIKQSLDKVKGLDDMTIKITKLVTVIQEVAEQTNLLALNAAIEAARAGEHGQGFAVVADEVRKLAEQVSLSVNDITETTTGIQQESTAAVHVLEEGYQAVSEGSNQIQTTGETLNKLNKIITGIGDEISTVSNSLYDVLDNTKLINDSITNIASVAEESAAGIAETEANAEKLSQSVQAIQDTQKSFEKGVTELFM
ncbi:methyl-accepting chemotaxis protein [Amphibacillus sediminis]|uniref:methyl-accepting chemotaxis protein n=1 Tax=Amphibacillus sediminis TaxID=360185 RepID=UPI00082A1EC5|nr:methyl-accepting chemotaxis protein [Amphibacillus sediminis]